MGSNWYPQWVYDKREDITRENMKQYESELTDIKGRLRDLNMKKDRLNINLIYLLLTY